MSFRGPVNTPSCTYNSDYQFAQKWGGCMSSHEPLWCVCTAVSGSWVSPPVLLLVQSLQLTQELEVQ